jgi:polysaccharide biosynthesis transport protein
MSNPDVERGELREYLDVIRARKWTIFLVFALVLGIALALSYRQTPLYVASTRLLVAGVPSGTSGFVSAPNLGTEAEVVDSVEVAEVAAKTLGVKDLSDDLLGGLSATPVSDTQVLTISYTSSDPQFAADAANAFANGYVTFKQEGARSNIEPLVERLQDSRRDSLEELTKIENRLEKAEAAVNPELAARLDQQRVQIESDLNLWGQRLQAALNTEASISLGGGEILQPATAPSQPSSPDHRTNGIIGGVFGIILGLATGFARDRLDNRFRSRVDAERTLSSPVLATVPRFKTPKGGHTIVSADPRGSASESYRTLRTNLQFLARQDQAKSFVVTSPQSNDGKTVTTANLAVALAQAGQRVAVVSADLRRPAIEKYLGLDGNGPGLSSWLQGETSSLGAIIRPSRIDNVSVIPSGPIPENPAELLTSARLRELIENLEHHFDFVLFDSVPALALADAAIVASQVDATILVIDSSSTHRPAAVHAKEELERVGGSLLGTVLNLYDLAGSPYYYYNYSPSKSLPPTSGNGSKNGASPNAPKGKRTLFGRRR